MWLGRRDGVEVRAMAMMIGLAVMEGGVQGDWVGKFLDVVVSKSVELGEDVFKFIMIVWQRHPTQITPTLISHLF